MRKFYALGLALLSVLAFAAVTAGAASAGVWLWNAEEVTVLLGTVTEGELLLEDMKAFPSAVDILCSGKFVGSVGPNGEDEITLLEGLFEPAVEDDLIDCEAHNLCSPALVWVIPVHLPWHTQIELMTNGEELDVMTGTGGEPGYKTECSFLGGTFVDECTTEETTHGQSILTNEVGGVAGEFSENETLTPPGKCTNGGAKAGLVVGTGLISTPEGGTLSVS